MESRRLFLAILLSLVVLIGWQYLMGPPPSPPAEPPGPRDGEPRTERVDEAPVPPPEEATEPQPAGEPATGETAPPEETSPPQERITAEAEERLVFETARTRVELTNRGGQVVSFLLKEHEAADGGPVDLVRARREGPYPFGLTDRSGRSHPLNDALFQARRLAEGQGVEFRYAGPRGAATKIFRFHPDERGTIPDLLDVDIQVEGDDDWSVLIGPGVRNPTERERSESYFARRRAVYSVGGEIERVDAGDPEGPIPVPPTGLRWVGLDDNYFLTVLLFEPGTATRGGAVLEPVLLIPGDRGARFEPVANTELLSEEQQQLARELRVRVEAGPEGFHTAAYWGAKRLEVLSRLAQPGTGGQVSAHLDHTIELGFLRLIADPLLRGLHWIHRSLVANYGWAIVLMTLLLKILLLPLTHKSYASMRKMQELQPKMEALRAKYRPKLKDKQGKPKMEAQRKMNEEMMALFKEEGVNPAGGCLPMLLQMPFFFAFYFILREAVELRNAAWLWVPDLSAPEPTAIHWLPLVMTVTQFLQQRMTPMAGDPMQRRLFQLLPFFFLVLFWGMPSGLVLYWLTNNVLTIGQQSIYNHLRKRGSDSEQADKKDGKARKKRSSGAKVK